MTSTSGNQTIASPSKAPAPPFLRFNVQSSDVIQDMRINVSEEHSDAVIWYKERFLSDEEIVENVVHNPSSTICWTIHRPKRGWYIRLRSPGFPPGAFIPLIPVSRTSPHYTDAALSFTSRTNITGPFQGGDTPESGRASSSSVHSYPPSPPVALVNPPSPSTVHAELQETPKSQKQKLALSLTQVTQFLLSPHSTQPVQPTSSSIFARALSVLKNHRPSHSNSFTLSRIPVTTNTPLSPPPPYVGTPGTPAEISQTSTANLSVAPPPPVLVFHDRTPVLTVRSLTGLIEIDRTEEQLMGVETSFWIAVALTYLEFLEERGSYLAALAD